MAARKKKAGTRRTVRKKAATAKRGGTAAGRTRRKPARRVPSAAFPEVEELVGLMDRHGLVEVDWEAGADGVRRIRLSRAGGAVAHAPAAPPLPAPPAAGGTSPALEPSGAPAAEPAAADEGLHAFKSPMVGTFYRAPSPESSPFVSVGDRVDATTTVCIIEAMKVMNEIVPDTAGEIVSIEVENGEAVEYGQTLFLLRTG